MKRLFDLAGALAGLLILCPLLLALGAAIWITSGLPAFFRQSRVGRRGRDFRLLKFRSMTVLEGAEQGRFDAGTRRRVTPIGRFLRKTKLDELPQLWNVFRGDMSLVGPRPEVRKWVEAYPKRWAFVHTVRPGITDPASIRFRNEEEVLAQSPDPEATYRDVILPQKLSLYEEYVRTRSFGGDIRILLQTVLAVVWSKAESRK
jgi:lipopolysaccharide/colanic/teichoic acid biosynthesis glycosyltransferase